MPRAVGKIEEDKTSWFKLLPRWVHMQKDIRAVFDNNV